MRFGILISFLLIFACKTTSVFGQVKTLNFPAFTEGESIKPYLELSDAYDKNDKVLVRIGDKFTPFSQNRDVVQYETNKKGCTWFRFKVKNNLPIDTALILAFWDYTDWMECFVSDADTLRSLGLVGEMAPIHKTSLKTDKVVFDCLCKHKKNRFSICAPSIIMVMPPLNCPNFIHHRVILRK